ncbi:hypothetical protein D9M70_498810 [compost metagenome]
MPRQNLRRSARVTVNSAKWFSPPSTSVTAPMPPAASASSAGANQSASRACMRSIHRPQSSVIWASAASSSIASTDPPGAATPASPAGTGRTRLPAACASPDRNGSSLSTVSARRGTACSAPPPYSQTEFTGSSPRASRAWLTGWSNQVIWISFCTRRQSRARSPACIQISMLRPAARSGVVASSGPNTASGRYQRDGQGVSSAMPDSCSSGSMAACRAAASSGRMPRCAGGISTR